MKTLLTVSAFLLTISSFGASGWLITVNESGMVRTAEKSNRIDPFASPQDYIILGTGSHQGLTTYEYPPTTWQRPRDIIEADVVTTNEFDEVVTNDVTEVVAWKYTTATVAGFDSLNQAGRDAVDALIAEAEAQALGPDILPRGIEVPYLVLQESTNRTIGVGLEVDEEGNLFTYQFHASPIDWDNVESNRLAEINRRSDIYTTLNMTPAQVRQHFQTDINTVFSSFTVPQRKYLREQKKITRYLLNHKKGIEE